MLNIYKRASLVLGPDGKPSFRINDTITLPYFQVFKDLFRVNELIVKTPTHDDVKNQKYLVYFPTISTIHFDNCKTAANFKPPKGTKVCIKLHENFGNIQNLKFDGVDGSELFLLEGVEAKVNSLPSAIL